MVKVDCNWYSDTHCFNKVSDHVASYFVTTHVFSSTHRSLDQNWSFLFLLHGKIAWSPLLFVLIHQLRNHCHELLGQIFLLETIAISSNLLWLTTYIVYFITFH